MMRELISQRKANFSLPQPFYTDDEFFKLDMEHIFYRQWLFAAHDCEIFESGDYITFDIGQQSIILVRDSDGSINAFHNSCKHRGSRICSKEKGSSARLVCPYHQWTYGLDGKLQFAKDMGEDFNLEDYKLDSVHCQSVAGCIFICMADDAPCFEQFKQRITPYLAPHNLLDAKVAHESHIIEEGNWKLVIENNRECYHCQGSHPELCRTYSDDPALTGVALSGGSSDIEAHWGKCDAINIPSRFHMDEEGQYRASRIPLLRDSKSFTLSGDIAVTKPMVASDDLALGSLLLFHYPNTWNHFLSDHAITFRITPVSTTQTIVTTKWLVHKDAVEGVDYDIDNLTKVWNATNLQDRQLVEENQRGVNSTAYSSGPYSPIHEDGVSQFVDWYCDFSLKALAQYKQADITKSFEVMQQVIDTASLQLAKQPIELTQPFQETKVQQAISTEENATIPLFPLEHVGKPSQYPGFAYIDETKPWYDQTQLLELVSYIPEAKDTMTFAFRAEGGSYFTFAPGQFITLELPVNGENIYRTYTISSSPSRPLSLSVTVKAQPDSIGTRWMLDNLRVGMKVRAFGPAGQFHLYNFPAKKYCFISAGSGITPMMSMTNYLYDRGNNIDINFIHCARSPSEIIFRNSLEQMSARVPGINLAWIVEMKDPFNAWAGYTGRFNQLILELNTPDFFEREIFCCGPEVFMQAVRDVLNAANFDMSHYHEESFAAPVTEVQEVDYNEPLPNASVSAKISFSLSEKTISSNQDRTILEASREAGLNIPSACNFGVCGTCKVKKKSGEVYMVHNGGISQRDEASGYILACCSKPIGDISIEY